MTLSRETSAFTPHNHASCVATVLNEVETACRAKNLKLTAVRRRVLEILLEEHRALGAYDILKRLSKEGLGSQPPVAYRALDFLIAHGFAHKLQQKNAFIACHHPDDLHHPAFMICSDCGHVAEEVLSHGSKALKEAATRMGFSIHHTNIEVEGICKSCDEQRPS